MDASSNEVELALEQLEKLGKAHLSLGRTMTEAHGGNLYAMDLLAYGALNRSIAHIRGFVNLIRSRNLLCAGAVLRLQLDTALRFSAAWLVEKPHDFAVAVLGGTKIQDLTDQSGNKMTDAYLVRRMGEEYSWVPRVYKRASGYIHFSSVHVLAAITVHPEEEHAGRLDIKISELDKELPSSLYVEAVEAFAACTKILLKYVHGWTFTKGNPDAVTRMKAERERSRKQDA